MMFCSQCGHELNEQDRCCPNCGASLEPENPMDRVLEEMKLRRKGGILTGIVIGVVAAAVIFAVVVAILAGTGGLPGGA